MGGSQNSQRSEQDHENNSGETSASAEFRSYDSWFGMTQAYEMVARACERFASILRSLFSCLVDGAV